MSDTPERQTDRIPVYFTEREGVAVRRAATRDHRRVAEYLRHLALKAAAAAGLLPEEGG